MDTTKPSRQPSGVVTPSADGVTPRPLLAWLSQPSPVRGIHFASESDRWFFHSYAEIAAAAASIAQGLSNEGLHKGDVVILIQPSSFAAVACWFGILLAGGVPAIVPPSNVFEKTQDYQERTTRCLLAVEPKFIVTTANASETLKEISGQIRVLHSEYLLRASGQAIQRETSPGELAMLQFTSGSSGSSRAVRVPFHALQTNIAAIHSWLGWKEEDATASWLPLHHDMGLVGCFLGTVTLQADLWLLAPEHFIRSPLRYLKCFGGRGAALTALPNFALEHIVRRVRPQALAGMDFSAWRAAIIGGEPVRAESLTAFHALLAPFGLRRESLLPAYGLAEATLAVAGLPLLHGWRTIAVDPISLAWGGRISLTHPSSQASCLVGCGHPLPGTSISIQDDSGSPLGERYLGEIIVHGDSVAAGYLGSFAETSTTFQKSRLHTGDIGFLHDGELFVVGRLGDSIKIRGRSLFAEDLEASLRRLEIPAHRLAILAGSRHANSCIVVLIEHPAKVDHSRVEAILRTRIGDTPLSIYDVPQGTISRTTSGKVRRRELWNKLLQQLSDNPVPIGVA